VERLKSSEASLVAQAEAHKAEVEELKKKVAEADEKFEVEAVKHEICEIERSRAQKNCDELRASKEKCYEISLECARKLKATLLELGHFPLSKNSSMVTLMESSSGSAEKSEPSMKF
jgi:predicted RNase H-like nuclease (RuvC/YqgF family)